MKKLILALFLSLVLCVGCSSNTLEVTHAEGVGSVTVSIGDEEVDITIGAEHHNGALCHSYALVYEDLELIGYAPNSPEECGIYGGFTINWLGLVNPILRIFNDFFLK